VRRRKEEEEEKYVGDPWHRSISTIEEIQHVELGPPNIYEKLNISTIHWD